jgi:DNA-3-methyladenine glycosylase II
MTADAQPASVVTGDVTRFEIFPSAPFRLDLTCWALRRRGHNRIDVWDGRYHRALPANGGAVVVAVEQRGRADQPVLAVTIRPGLASSGHVAAEIRGQVEQLLGVRVDLAPFYALAAEDPRLRTLATRFRGVRPPRFPTLFESLANAVANQQLSLDVGIELLNQLCDAFGERPPGHRQLAAFPDASTIAGVAPAELRSLGFSEAKARYLIGLAGAVVRGEIDAEIVAAADRSDATARLTALHGIGRWSAEYVLLRGSGRLDVFPGDDVGARNKLQRFMDLAHPPTYDEIRGITDRWQPYAGMVYFHLLLDALSRTGRLDR